LYTENKKPPVWKPSAFLLPEIEKYTLLIEYYKLDFTQVGASISFLLVLRPAKRGAFWRILWTGRRCFSPCFC